MTEYPKVKDPKLVGNYPALVKSGGGYVWDAVLEYRVWCHPHDETPDIEDGDDYFYAFDNYEEALVYSNSTKGAEEPIALILQEEYIDEPEAGKYIHVKEQRLTEWHVEFLSRPKRNENTIPDFMSPNAPSNRLDIIRGLSNK
jgi:hypothetical protein